MGEVFRATVPAPAGGAVQAEGLRVYYPGRNITASKDAIFGAMLAGGQDLVLGSTSADSFPDARVDGWSDWFVRVRLGGEPKSAGMIVSYGHGSPFVYALYDAGGAARVTFATEPKVWSGDAKQRRARRDGERRHITASSARADRRGRASGGKVLTNRSAGEKRYFSLAVLPDADEKTLALFRRYAYSHVTDTKVSWGYDSKTAAVTTRSTLQRPRTSRRREGHRHAVRALPAPVAAHVRGAARADVPVRPRDDETGRRDVVYDRHALPRRPPGAAADGRVRSDPDGRVRPAGGRRGTTRRCGTPTAKASGSAARRA